MTSNTDVTYHSIASPRVYNSHEQCPPAYDETQQVPPYTLGNTRRTSTSMRRVKPTNSASRSASRHTDRSHQSRSARRQNRGDSQALSVRPPPEGLLSRSRHLPPSNQRSPFESHPDHHIHRTTGVTRNSSASLMPRQARHGDHAYHKFHNISDDRMHTRPKVDHQNRPVRSSASGTMIAGAAVGLVALATCNIM